ncbi:hypothetical protein [Chlorogloeopsis sp. ULAP02]|uniref:hypothetical protein n=1 Tax=Chlorogloeopsis sp. ULAP02 TaxID=3107926 RepID=UPI0031376BCE
MLISHWLVGAGFVDHLAVQTDNLSSKPARTMVSSSPHLLCSLRSSEPPGGGAESPCDGCGYRAAMPVGLHANVGRRGAASVGTAYPLVVDKRK